MEGSIVWIVGEVGHLETPSKSIRGGVVRWDIYDCTLRLSNSYLLNVIWYIDVSVFIFVIKWLALKDFYIRSF